MSKVISKVVSEYIAHSAEGRRVGGGEGGLSPAWTAFLMFSRTACVCVLGLCPFWHIVIIHSPLDRLIIDSLVVQAMLFFLWNS
jgi:hypothetical protein